jgi:trans-AT polyketide synthase/acyltransferase/oxidoreductase domain-containing protein
MRLIHSQQSPLFYWQGDETDLVFDIPTIKNKLLDKTKLIYIVSCNNQLGITTTGQLVPQSAQTLAGYAMLPALPAMAFGSNLFCDMFRTQSAYMAGAMANGIASTALVIALGQAGMLGSFGAAGLSLVRIEEAIQEIQVALTDKPYCFNLIHSPQHPHYEHAIVDLYLQKKVKNIEASAFMTVTSALVLFRVAGLSVDSFNKIQMNNRIIAKVSHPHVAAQFMQPPPADLVAELLQQGKLTSAQAQLAAHIPLADAITVEADSGGHTDNQALSCLFPLLQSLRDKIQSERNYKQIILLGAAGGMGTPQSLAAAMAMGADYVVTGSINQACEEAGTSAAVKRLLADIKINDVTMAPAPDMFEMGVNVQVVKRGSLFAMRAQKLRQIYTQYPSMESIPPLVKTELEQQIFKQSLTAVWAATAHYLQAQSASRFEIIANDPKRKLAAICKWYMSQSSDWATGGVEERALDYQIWCGPALSAFNCWIEGSPLANEPRRVVTIAQELLAGATYLQRINGLRACGIQLPYELYQYQPLADITSTVPGKVTPISCHAIQSWLAAQVAHELQVPPESIDIRQPFVSFQIDSAQAMLMLVKLEKWLKIKLSPTMIWSYPSIEALAMRLTKLLTPVLDTVYE